MLLLLRLVWMLLKKLIIGFLILSILGVLLFKWVPVPVTPLMLTRAVENKWDGRDWQWEHDWVPLDSISPQLQKAVIAAEDARFMEHSGFDLKALELAYKHNQKGKRIRGGSTISQQTAKNVFLWQGRSYVRKGLEAYFTVLIEFIWGKKRILEVYLNSIEMGPSVYGAEAASEHWFGKHARDLKRRQAAGIAAILPNPLKFKPKSAIRHKRRILSNMRHIKGLPE